MNNPRWFRTRNGPVASDGRRMQTLNENWRESPECKRAEAEGWSDFWHGESDPVKTSCKYDAIDDPVEHAGYITGYYSAQEKWAESNPEEKKRREERYRNKLATSQSVGRSLQRLDKAMPMGRADGLIWGGES